MKIKLEFAGYRGAFDTSPYDVLVKVKRDKPEYWPWQRVLDVYFYIEKYPKELGGGWHLKSWTDESDKYMIEKFGAEHLRCDDRKGLIKVLEQIIPDWIGEDYSGGMVRKFEFID